MSFQSKLTETGKHLSSEVHLESVPSTSTNVESEMTVASTDSDNQQACPAPDVRNEVVPHLSTDETPRKKKMRLQIASLTRKSLKQATRLRHFRKKTC